MTHRVRRASAALLMLLAACSESEPAPDSGTGAGAGGSGASAGSSGSGGAGQHGDAGTHVGGSGGSCREREEQASQAITAVLDTADLNCERTEDCENVSIDTACHAACGFLAGPEGKRVIEAAIAEQNAGICATFEEDGCVLVIPPCVPPRPFGCVAGRCEWLDGTQDAGSGDDAGFSDGCVDRTVRFGHDGGLVAFQDVNTLAPCREFSIVRESFADPGSAASCSNQVATNAEVTADDIDAALAHADVQAAFAAAPVLFGTDPRALDGTVFRIDVGGKIVEVGGPCTGASGCRAIPAGVSALRDLLERLNTQQRALPDCDALLP